MKSSPPRQLNLPMLSNVKRPQSELPLASPAPTATAEQVSGIKEASLEDRSIFTTIASNYFGQRNK